MEQITNKKSAVDNEVANGNQLSSLKKKKKKSPTKILSEFDRMKNEMSLRRILRSSLILQEKPSRNAS